MKRSCNQDDLEALVEGGLSPEDAAEVQGHAGSCATCGEELRWLRQERELMRRRSAREPVAPLKMANLWAGVESRVRARPPVRAWWRPLGFSTAVAAAAVLAFVAGRQAAERSRVTTPIEVSQAPAARYRPVAINTSDEDEIDQAEEQWRTAAEDMEEAYQRQRPRMRASEAVIMDASLAKARRSITNARLLAGRDVEARVAVLDGYSQYVRSLHTVVSDLEVVK